MKRAVFFLIAILGALALWRFAIVDRLPTVTVVAPTVSSASTSRATSSAASGGSATQTPIEAIVQNKPLAATYYYHFAAGVPNRVRNLYLNAIAQYNHTGIVRFVAGAGSETTNTVSLGVYHKTMPAGEQTFELGKGGPQIIERWGATTSTVNHAEAQLNLTYSAQLSDAVAVHELGHVLGLDHSSSESSVMYPVDRGVDTLSGADLAALKAIYAQ